MCIWRDPRRCACQLCESHDLDCGHVSTPATSNLAAGGSCILSERHVTFCQPTGGRLPKGVIASVDESGTTDASHSLGIYKPNAGGAGDSAELVQHFRGGEICPETSAPRRADVRLECCAVANAEDGGAALTVGSLTETSKCVYTIVLCVQALCVGAKPLIPDVLPASALLAPLQNACFQWRPPRVSFIFLYSCHHYD